MPKRKKFKRVVILADMHCGSLVGLTPPKWFSEKKEFYQIQKECWKFFTNEIDKLGKIDICIVNGDCIDGRQEKQGSTGLIAVDRREQVQMALECLEQVRAKKFFLTFGTGYHTGNKEDFEADLCDRLKKNAEAVIGGHLFVKVNGVIFDCKHKVNASTVPYGRHTPVAREKLWNQLWSIRKEQPNSDVVIRSHTHYLSMCGDRDYLAITTPALQGLGSKYGSRACSGTVDYGFLHFDIDEKGDYTWQAHMAEIEAQKAQILVG